MEKKTLYLILLILGCAFWGISYPVTKLAVGNLSTHTFLFYRFLLATIVLCFVFSKSMKETNRETIIMGMKLAIPLLVGIHLQTLGLKYSSASQCSLIASTCVVIVPVMKVAFFRKKIALKIWLAALMALAGTIVISLRSDFKISIGDLYTTAGSLGFAVYLINVERYTARRNIIPTIVPMFATCTIVTFIIALLDTSAAWQPDSQVFWLGIVYCALFSTAFMYSVSNISQRYISAEKVAIIYLFEPVFAAFFAFLILDESLSVRLLVGGLLIFGATIISEIKLKQPLE
ncbi:DMT family transporter [Chitinophaga sp.]|uniref:DMT family transporter n=1 Tax=Chitinophaga sp. TaxID=1869181 RepID=UPI0031DF7B92